MERHPNCNAIIPNWVIACNSNGHSPETIYNGQRVLQPLDLDGNWLLPAGLSASIGFDEIIFILTRFVPGFAESFR